LKQALRFASQNAVPVFVLGSGSNVLFPDEGYRGLVVKNAICGQEIKVVDDAVLVTVGAGENWDAFVEAMCALDYWGLENLSAIPGTVGATPIQNVGAYGAEVSEVITHVTAVHKDSGEEKQFTQSQCQFDYRDSYFKSMPGKCWVVTAVTFQLSSTPKPNFQYADLHALRAFENVSAVQVRNTVMDIRAKKFPDWHKVGTAGSFFKNPIVTEKDYQRLKELYPAMPAHQTVAGDWKLSLGWILDKVCELKGFCVNDVCLYEKQALVLINTGTSTENIYTFVVLVTKKVFEKTQIKIEPEVLLVKNEIT
jgi:UDP-N-acetylmuramate dehydrogenase